MSVNHKSEDMKEHHMNCIILSVQVQWGMMEGEREEELNRRGTNYIWQFCLSKMRSENVIEDKITV